MKNDLTIYVNKKKNLKKCKIGKNCPMVTKYHQQEKKQQQQQQQQMQQQLQQQHKNIYNYDDDDGKNIVEGA